MDIEVVITALTAELEQITGYLFAADEELSDGGFDSFALLQLVAFLEDELGVAVPDERLAEEHFRNITLIAGWVRTGGADQLEQDVART